MKQCAVAVLCVVLVGRPFQGRHTGGPERPALRATPAAVADKVAFKAHAFALQDVRLLDGPFKQAMMLDQEYLLSLDPIGCCTTSA